MTLCFWLTLRAAAAQVPNDNIENRRVLAAEQTITSSTVGCTVQRSCVDERLTGQCIEYHNDQWFEFRPPAAGTYYVNIGGQRCRDVRGVQLVVLTGTPCQPATYRVLSCTSLGTQDDLFVALPGLRAGQPYLLDVDGYLHDFCSFTLQVSGHARGLPAGPPPAVPAGPPGASRVVELSWRVPDSLASAQRCRVLRREAREFRATEVAAVPLSRDSYGQRRADYALTDTLPRVGRYLYQVVAEGEAAGGPPVVLSQLWRSYSQLRPVVPGAVGADDPHLDLPLARYPRGATLTVRITEPGTGRLLRRGQLVLDDGPPGQGRLATQAWLDAGLRNVEIELICQPRRGTAFTEHLFFSLVAAPGSPGPAVPLLK